MAEVDPRELRDRRGEHNRQPIDPTPEYRETDARDLPLIPKWVEDWRQRPDRRNSSLGATMFIPAPITKQWDQEQALDAEGVPLPRLRWCYGAPLVTDPRDFFPDPWYCTPIELMSWRRAVFRWEAGLLVRFPGDGYEPWGIGISVLRPHDDEYQDPSAAWKRDQDVASDT